MKSAQARQEKTYYGRVGYTSGDILIKGEQDKTTALSMTAASGTITQGKDTKSKNETVLEQNKAGNMNITTTGNSQKSKPKNRAKSATLRKQGLEDIYYKKL